MTVRELLKVEGLPVLQNRVYDTRETARSSPVGDVVLVQDTRTGLVFNSAFDASLLVYDESYQNEQACSPSFQRHLDEVLTLISRHFTGKQVLEVGCGKGYFLELLRSAGFAATGVDPAFEGDSRHVVKAPFEVGLGLSGEGIVLRHVLEHMPHPLDFLASIAKANGGKGMIYIEVPCLDWICDNRAWFDVFYEHVNYFRLRDFRQMFGRVHESGHLFGGQYIYVVADLATLHHPRAAPEDSLQLPPDFLGGIDTCSQRALSSNGTRAVWGGSSKGVIFCHHLSRRDAPIDVVIDINQAKQGRYVPVTGVPIISPLEATVRVESGALVFVMNPNYYDEIVAESNFRFTYSKV